MGGRRRPHALRRARRRGPQSGRRGRARGSRPARPRVRELRRLPRLRGARRALPLARGGAVSALKLSAIGPRRKAGAQTVEYSLLLTATLCLLAFGVVMVFSASSTTSLLGQSGDSAYYLKRTALFGGFGLLAMKALSGRGARALRPLTPMLLFISLGLLVLVMLPGFGQSVNGAQRWIGAGPLQVQPSELAKLALI